MGLSINSFDLMALIESLQSLIPNEPETPMTDLLNDSSPASEKLTEILEDTAPSFAISEEVLQAAIDNIALRNSSAPVSEVILDDTQTSTILSTQMTPMLPPLINSKMDEEMRRAIQEIIRSLQTSVIHSYQSSDIIGEDFSLNNLSNSAKANRVKEAEDGEQSVKEEKRRAERKNEDMREDLRRAIFKNRNQV